MYRLKVSSSVLRWAVCMSCFSSIGVHNQKKMTAHKSSSVATGLLLATLAVLSCHRPDYFPLKDNMELRFAATEYEVVGNDTTRTESPTYAMAVTDSAFVPNLGRVYDIQVTRDEEPYMSFFLRKTRDGIFVLPASQVDEIEMAQGWVRLLEVPLRENALWYGDTERSVSFEVVAREDVMTSAGRVRNCFRIRIHADEPYLMDIWLAPDVGIIRWNRRLPASRYELSERLRR